MEAKLRARLEDELIMAMRHAAEHPAVWGVDDCALWCAETLRRALGYDAAAAFRTGYTDRQGAAAAVGHLGLGFALRRAARDFGWRKVDPQLAATGDVGLALIPDKHGRFWPTTMICRCRGWFVGRGAYGYTALDARAVRVAWSVV